MRSHVLTGLLHAIGIAVYVAIVVTFMQNAQHLFGRGHTFVGPIAFLLLFVVSTAITGTLVLGRPVLAYLDGRKSDAIALFLATLAWLVLILVATFLTLALMR